MNSGLRVFFLVVVVILHWCWLWRREKQLVLSSVLYGFIRHILLRRSCGRLAWKLGAPVLNYVLSKAFCAVAHFYACTVSKEENSITTLRMSFKDVLHKEAPPPPKKKPNKPGSINRQEKGRQEKLLESYRLYTRNKTKQVS